MKTVYVAGRTSEIPLVQSVQALCVEMGFTISYDWTSGPMWRGSGREDILHEIGLDMLVAATRSDIFIGLLSNGAKSRSAGLHCEFGAYMGHKLSQREPPKALLWSPSDIAPFAPRDRDCLSFYMTFGVVRRTWEREWLLEGLPQVLRGWR